MGRKIRTGGAAPFSAEPHGTDRSERLSTKRISHAPVANLLLSLYPRWHFLQSNISNGASSSLYCLTISLAMKPDCITLTGSIASSSDDALNIQIVRTAFRYGMWIPEAFFSSHETYMGRDDITYIINLWLNDFLYNRSEDLTTATYIGIVNEFPVIP